MILAFFFDLKIIMQAHKTICAFLFFSMIDAVMIVKLNKFIKRNMLDIFAFNIETIETFLMRGMIAFSFNIFLHIFLLSFWLTQRTMAILTMMTLLLCFFWIFCLFCVKTIKTFLIRTMRAFSDIIILLLSLRNSFNFNQALLYIDFLAIN